MHQLNCLCVAICSSKMKEGIGQSGLAEFTLHLVFTDKPLFNSSQGHRNRYGSHGFSPYQFSGRLEKIVKKAKLADFGIAE